MSSTNRKLCPWALAFALGITWAIGIFIMGIVAWQWGWGNDMVRVISSIYHGFEPTFWGSVLGAIWAFVDWFIGGLIIGWVYNLCVSCGCGKKEE